jgi:hypothetical protein
LRFDFTIAFTGNLSLAGQVWEMLKGIRAGKPGNSHRIWNNATQCSGTREFIENWGAFLQKKLQTSENPTLAGTVIFAGKS